jgi:hypothetical protein
LTFRSGRVVVAACLRSGTTEIGNLVASLVSGEQQGDAAHLGAPDRPEVYSSVDAVTFNRGITAECLGGIETGHRELPGRIDWWMDR